MNYENFSMVGVDDWHESKLSDFQLSIEPSSVSSRSAPAKTNGNQAIKAVFEKAMVVAGYKESSIRSNMKVLSTFLAGFSPRTFPEIPTSDFLTRYAEILEDNSLSNSYKSSIANVLKLFLHYSRDIPLRDLHLPVPQRSEKPPEILRKEEIMELIQLAPNLKQKCMIMFLYGTGIRTFELRNLRREALDLRRGKLKINEVSASNYRLLPLPSRIREPLEEYLLEYNPRTFLFEGRYENTPIAERGIQSILSQLGQALGLEKKVTPGVLRNSFATHLLRKGAALEYVSHLLGHQNVASTRKFLSLVPMVKPNSPLEDLEF